jgi:hypothetical protein
MMDAGDQGAASVVSFDQMKVPKRSGGVELAAYQVADHLLQRFLVARLLEGDPL